MVDGLKRAPYVGRSRKKRSSFYLVCTNCDQWAPFGSSKPSDGSMCRECGTSLIIIKDVDAYPISQAVRHQSFGGYSVIDKQRQPDLINHLRKYVDKHLHVRDL